MNHIYFYFCDIKTVDLPFSGLSINKIAPKFSSYGIDGLTMLAQCPRSRLVTLFFVKISMCLYEKLG